jgi:hypothetical protein
MQEDNLLSLILVTSDVKVNPDNDLAVQHSTVNLIEDVVFDVHYFADHAHLVVVVIACSYYF